MEPLQAPDGRVRIRTENRDELRFAEEAEQVWHDSRRDGIQVSYGQGAAETRDFSFNATEKIIGGLQMVFERRGVLERVDWPQAGAWLVKLDRLSNPDYQAAVEAIVKQTETSPPPIAEEPALADDVVVSIRRRRSKTPDFTHPDKTAA